MFDSDKDFDRLLSILGIISFLFFIFTEEEGIRIASLVVLILLGPVIFLYYYLQRKSKEKLDKAFNNRYKEVEKAYRNAFWRYRSDKRLLSSFSDTQKKEFISIPDKQWELWQKEEEAIREENRRIGLEISRLENDAPNGLSRWLEQNSMKAIWRDQSIGEPSGCVKRTTELVLKNSEIILQLEDFYRRSQCDKSWLSAQKQFSKEIVTLIKKEFSFLGRYVYSAPVKLVNEEGNVSESSLSIWQLFFHGYCTDVDLDYSLFPNKVKLLDYLSNNTSKTDWKPYAGGLYGQVIITALMALLEKYKDLAVVIYNDELIKQFYDELIDGVQVSQLRNQDHLFIQIMISLSVQLKDKKIPSYNYSEIRQDLSALQYRKLFVITNQTATNEIISFTQQLWESSSESRPCISFLSLFKEYSPEEMQALIDEKNKAIAEEEEQKRKEQELIDSLPSKVEGWETLSPFCKLKIKYLLDYYPTTVEFEADDDEWDDRWTVWNFKNDPGKTPEEAHQRVLNRVVPKFAGILKDTFGEESLKYLTLVCIPASTQIKNDARYKEFSGRLCQETGMGNGFDYTHITVSREARHNGGEEGVVNYSFDDSFFNGKRVILLDDIITKGNSMRIAKAKLEKLGAQVICGLSVGKTRHERRGRPDMDEE